MTIASALVANLILLLAAVGYGSLVRSLFPQSFTRIDRVALTLLGGLGLLGLILFCVGLAWFSHAAIYTVLLPGVLLGIKVFLFESFEFYAPLPLLPCLLIAAVLLITVVGGLAEPVGGIHMDAISSHFLGPKVWLRDSQIRPVLEEHTTSFPTLVESQFAAVMAIGGQVAPGFFSVIALLAIALLAAALAVRAGLNDGDSWWVVALVVTMPVVYRGAYGGLYDVIYCGFVLAAARVAFDAEKPAHFILAGMFSGFAMGTKYFGLFAGVVLAACLILLELVAKKYGMAAFLKNLAIAGAAAAIVASPWYLRNWVVLGSPMYPPPLALLKYFPARYISLEALQKLQARMVREGSGMGRDPLNFLLLPFHLAFHPANFINGPGGIGLTPLALAPFGLFASRKNRFILSLALFAALLTVTWFLTMQEARYLIHVYVIAAVFAVSGWNYVKGVSPRLGRALACATVGVSVIYGLFMIGGARADDVRAAVSRTFAEKRRASEIPYFESFTYLNRQPEVRKVLILDPRVPAYYSDKPYIKPRGRNGEEPLPEIKSLPQLLSEAPRLGVTHILDVDREGSPFQLPENTQGLTLVFQADHQRIYRVD